MYNLKTVITALVCFFPVMSAAQEPIISGSKTAYHYDPTLTLAPEGYQPFYIDHVGRHGARYSSSEKDEQLVYKVLSLADKNKQLTQQGQQLLTQIISIMQLNQGHYGELTDLGRQNIQHIGQRMLNNYPTVFTGKHLDVLSSTVPRAKESAEIFLQPFKVQYPDVQIRQQEQQTILRFFDYSPAYLQYKKSRLIKEQVESIEQAPQTIAMSKTVAERIFTDAFLEQLDKGVKGITSSPIKTHDFVIALYAIYQEILSFTAQTINDNHLDFTAYFSMAENNWFATVVTAKNYLQIGPAFDANGIQIKIAAPLLWDMIHSADQAILGKRVDANLRFGHAETVSPLATLLEIEHTNIVAGSLFDYPAVWQAAQIIPMGANIQFIFYQRLHAVSNQSSNAILVKILLNEKEVHLPVATDSYPYYRWDDVKQFYVEKLNRLGLSDVQPAITLLQEIKE